MKPTGTDVAVVAEMLFLAGIPFALIGAGVFLRRKCKAPEEGDSAGRKTGRVCGTLLLWGGVLSVLLCAVFALNYLGKI